VRNYGMTYELMCIIEYLDFSVEICVQQGMPYVVKMTKIMKEVHTRELVI